MSTDCKSIINGAIVCVMDRKMHKMELAGKMVRWYNNLQTYRSQHIIQASPGASTVKEKKNPQGITLVPVLFLKLMSASDADTNRSFAS